MFLEGRVFVLSLGLYIKPRVIVLLSNWPFNKRYLPKTSCRESFEINPIFLKRKIITPVDFKVLNTWNWFVNQDVLKSGFKSF